MAELSVRTRENGNPQGRPNVYLAIQPEDMQEYFEAVCSELLTANDCAIYYCNSPHTNSIEDEEFFQKLQHMSLIVVPVTKTLLSHFPHVLELEISFAQKNNISILPLIREPGVEKRFNELFDDLHCLHSYNTHPDFPDYPGRLSNYLQAVFMNDFEKEEIKKYFSSRIFLSYRRQDHSYAQQLMRIIHQQPQYQDVAIWYDKFLIPGENFNDTIKEEIAQSDLFVMVVTPNILKNDNYVMKHEYPEALKAQKPIVAVEMVHTNHNNLRRYFSEITENVDICDVSALVGALDKYLPTIKKAEYCNSHDYYIGLAYLYGFMVENDSTKAVSFITSSAENGYKEAIHRLAYMYLTGNGVPRDTDRALIWSRRYVDILKQEAKENPDIAPISLAYAQKQLGDIYRESNLQQALVAYEAYVRTMYLIACHEGSPVFYRHLAEACCELGNMHRTAGNRDSAYRCVEQGIHLTKQIAEQLKTSASMRSYAKTCDYYGHILTFDGMYAEAKKQFATALELRQKANAHIVDHKESLAALSSSYGNLSRVCGALGENEECLLYSKLALEIDEKTNLRERTTQSLHNLLISTLDMGNSMLHAEEWEEAKTYLERAVQLAKQLVEKNSSVEHRRYLALGFCSLGQLYYRIGQYDDAVANCTKTIELFNKLDRTVENAELKRELSWAYIYCGKALEQQKKLSDAAKKFEEALHLLETLHDDGVQNYLSELEYVQDSLADLYLRMGASYNQDNKYDEAIIYLEKAAEAFKKRSANGNSFARKAAVAYEYLGNIFFAAGKIEKSLLYFEQSLTLRRNFPYEKEKDRLMELSVSYFMLGKVYANLNDLDKSQKHIEDALECVEKLPENLETLHRLNEGLQLLTQVCIQNSKKKIAAEYAKQAYSVAYELFKTARTEEALYQFGIAAMTAGMIRGVEKLIEQAHEIFGDLVETDSGNASYQKMLNMSERILRDLK